MDKIDKMFKMFDLLLDAINTELNTNRDQVWNILYKYQDSERADFEPKYFNQDILIANFEALLAMQEFDPKTILKVEQINQSNYYKLMEIWNK